jgi:glycosyltransferase involved in cell wall biosynthesis
MRILIATRHNFVVGGVETYLRALLPLLRERGHEIALAYELGSTTEAPLDPKGDARAWAIGSPNAMLDIAMWKPDLAVVHSLDGGEHENALLDRFPSVAYVHAYTASCISGTKVHRLPFIHGCERKLGPACLAMYLPCRCVGLSPVTMVRSYRAAQRNLRTLKRYMLVLAASPHMSEECLRNGVPAARLRTLPPFPPNVEGQASPPAPRRKLGRSVLFMGRLTPLKGAVHLVDAMALASRTLGRRLHLDVTGEGAEREAVATHAKKGAVTVDFHGWVDAERLPPLMDSVDILAVPSLWPEPFGVVGIEAGSYGLPSVAFATGGIPSWLRPGVSGELAPTPPTVQGLADALVRALRNPEHLDSLRLGAWRVAREFSPERHVKAIEAALLEAARSSGTAATVPE